MVIPPPGDPSKKLLKSPTTPLGKYKKVEPLSTQMHVGRNGDYVGATGDELKLIRDQRRAKGLPDDEISCRMDLLDRRIAQAYAVRKTRDVDAGGVSDPNDPRYRGDVVSVFTAPEWTFKIPGQPLTPKQRDNVIKHYKTLSKRYPGMLIVPGTTVTNKGTKDHPQIDAEAIVVHNGQIVHRTHKKKGGQDLDGYMTKEQKNDYHKEEKYFVGLKNSPNDTSLFNFEGMKFSLEICADHGPMIRRAKTDASNTGTGEGVDVQILVSDGAEIDADGLAAHPGGLVITNDAKQFYNDAGESGGIREVARPGDYVRKAEINKAFVSAKNQAKKDGLAAPVNPTPVRGAQTFEDVGLLLAPAPVEIRRT